MVGELFTLVADALAGFDPFTAGALDLVDIEDNNSVRVARLRNRNLADVRQALHAARGHIRDEAYAYLARGPAG